MTGDQVTVTVHVGAAPEGLWWGELLTSMRESIATR